MSQNGSFKTHKILKTVITNSVLYILCCAHTLYLNIDMREGLFWTWVFSLVLQDVWGGLFLI